MAQKFNESAFILSKAFQQDCFAKVWLDFVELLLKYFIKEFLGFLLPVGSNSPQNIDNTDSTEICYNSYNNMGGYS